MSFSFTFTFIHLAEATSEPFVPVNVEKTWTEAQSYCRHNYTDLASVRNQSENDKIQTFVQNNPISPDKAWIGLSRLWVWSDNNSKSTFTHWLSGEPDCHFEPNSNENREHVCTSIDIHHHQGRWVDDKCTGSYPFVCYDGKKTLSLTQSSEQMQLYM